METIKMTKRQLSEWEKIAANEATVKGLLSTNYSTQAAHATQYQIDKPNKKMGIKQQNKHFSKDDIHKTTNHMQRCSTPLLEKCKLKLPGRITSHQSEWPASKINLQGFPGVSVVMNLPDCRRQGFNPYPRKSHMPLGN